ncbi:MAG: ABC transporter ATP-binding protein [Anaerolineae bacterium]|nr:ABC transporter ATP-binding protein [Anaerolineae bacterium]
MSENHPVIEATQLTRRFGKTVAVDGLDLSVARGEVFGLIGPDGAGKTTALRLLAAVMLPTAGQVRVLGFDTRRQAERIRRVVGYMPQRFSLYGDLTVAENLNFFADVFGVRGRERRERIDRLLGFARLTEFTGRRAAALSGGMQKKLALACALIHAPQVILLDEPTTGVDPISRREFWDILAELHVTGVTILVSTPYMDEAERCSRIGLMYEGRLIECGPPEALRSQVTDQLLAVWTPAVMAARQALAPLPEVLEIQTYGDVLHIFVADAAAAEARIAAALAGAGIPVTEIKRTKPRVEEAFISLIQRRRK